LVFTYIIVKKIFVVVLLVNWLILELRNNRDHNIHIEKHE
jgi:hypothetical protein